MLSIYKYQKMEKFNLKWNDFQVNVSKSFGLFRNESYLHDVTLVSDDYKHIPAHKLVLSASSEYFRNILQETKQQVAVKVLFENLVAHDETTTSMVSREMEIMRGLHHENIIEFITAYIHQYGRP